MLITDFYHTVEAWNAALQAYNTDQLTARPAADKWSIGQVYVHIISQTNYFIAQARICASGNENANRKVSAEGRAMLLANEFPDQLLQGPPSNAQTPQPVNLQGLAEDLAGIRQATAEVFALAAASRMKGKTKHPGLGYFDADEWLHFAEMHMRHHFRQKKRIDAWLGAQSTCAEKKDSKCAGD